MIKRVDSNQEGYLRSGELAQIAGVSKDTLRHYERIGVLQQAERTDSGYRLYPASSAKRVLTVRAALALGISLGDLAEIFSMRGAGQAPCEEVRRIACKRLGAVEKQIESLVRLRDHLKEILEDWDKRLNARAAGELAYLLEELIEEPSANIAAGQETT